MTFKVRTRKGDEDLLVDEDGEEVSYDPLG